MLKALATVLAVFVVVAFATANNASIDRNPGLVVHEWGTFTTVAGPDGMPVDWLPLAGPADLPCFVNHYINPVYKYSLSTNPCLTYQQARTRLKGKVRMETPVLYFYSPRQETVNVRVDFPQGLVTEWYPPATVSQVDVRERSLIDNAVGSLIEWKSVRILPGLQANFPLENRPSHYYAARETDAAPVQVKGKDEKFLFYRGVGSFPVPLKTQVTSNEKIRIEIKNTEVIPALVLFEKRDERIGFRVLRAVQGVITLDPPAFGADFASLRRELENILTAEGLYAKEAHAMVETWRDSWFEEGTRIFYIVPRAIVDSVLPLSVDPAPSPDRVARAFVGRMEVITPESVQEVANAIATKDMAVLKKHGRFLGPITDRLAMNKGEIQSLLDAAFKSFLGDVAAGCN